MDFQLDFASINNQWSEEFEELAKTLKRNHSIDLLDSDKYLFNALYNRIFEQIKDTSTNVNLVTITTQIQEIFSSELIKLNGENQNRFEYIMSNSEEKTKIFDFVSKLVYHHLSNKTIDKKHPHQNE